RHQLAFDRPPTTTRREYTRIPATTVLVLSTSTPRASSPIRARRRDSPRRRVAPRDLVKNSGLRHKHERQHRDQQPHRPQLQPKVLWPRAPPPQQPAELQAEQRGKGRVRRPAVHERRQGRRQRGRARRRPLGRVPLPRTAPRDGRGRPGARPRHGRRGPTPQLRRVERGDVALVHAGAAYRAATVARVQPSIQARPAVQMPARRDDRFDRLVLHADGARVARGLRALRRRGGGHPPAVRGLRELQASRSVVEVLLLRLMDLLSSAR
ncbi:unnamed protein product, partial [Pelagomonas calceolata]